MGTGSFPEVKRPGRGADHPPSSKCRGQERVRLYLYSPSGPSWPVMGEPIYIYVYMQGRLQWQISLEIFTTRSIRQLIIRAVLCNYLTKISLQTLIKHKSMSSYIFPPEYALHPECILPNFQVLLKWPCFPVTVAKGCSLL